MNYTSKWLWFDLKTNFDKICQTQNNSRVGAKSKSCQINILGVMYYDWISNELYFQMIMIWFQISIFMILPNYEITYSIRTLHKIIVSQNHLYYHRQCIHILCICVLDLFRTFCKVVQLCQQIVPIQRLVQDNQLLQQDIYIISSK